MKRRISLILLLSLFGAEILAQDSKLQQRLNYGRAHLTTREFSKAMEHFNAVLKEEPKNMEATLGRLQALQGLGNRAEISKTENARGKANTAESQVISAQISLMRRDMKGAVASLQKAISLDKEDYLAHTMMGSLERYKKNYTGAVKHLKAAIAANKDYPEAYYELGETYFVQSDAGNAARYWRQYLEMIPRLGKRYQYVNGKMQKLVGN